MAKKKAKKATERKPVVMMKPIKPSQWGSVVHHHIAISGGRTSGKMTYDWLKCNGWKAPKNSSLTFCNTGQERNETLDYVQAMSEAWGVKVVWLEYDRVPAKEIDLSIFPTPRRAQYVEKQAKKGELTHWFKIVDYNTAHRIGQPNSPFDKLLEWMSVLPNPVSRSCSGQMKARTMFRYLWSIGVRDFTSYIGYRADEADRAVDLLCQRDLVPGQTFSFPLIDWGVNEEAVMEFWKQQPFNLQLQQFEGNCDLCFMKSVPKRIELMRRNPASAKWWIDWESRKDAGAGSRFRLEQSYASLLERSKTALPILLPEGEDGCGACTAGTLSYAEDGE